MSKNETSMSINIYLGLRPKYGFFQYSYRRAENTVRRYAPERFECGCVTVTKTKFYYKGGWERGLIIGLINYPRFPVDYWELHRRGANLATYLADVYGQNKVTLVGFTGDVMADYGNTDMYEKGVDY